MPRILKNPKERRNELLDVAEELFINKGYNETAVSDIVKKISVAQGTFYYYFKSKEEIFVAIFDRHLQSFIKTLNYKINNSCITALEKLKEFIKLDFEDKFVSINTPLVKHLHEEQNTGLHQKVMVTKILGYKLVLTEIISQGIEKGEFQTDYPEEISEFILTSSAFSFDPSIFGLRTEEYPIKLVALLDLLEKALSLPKGSLDMNKLFKSHLDNYK